MRQPQPVMAAALPEWAVALKEARGRLKINQTRLGELVGVDQRTVSDWEKGAHNIPPTRWQAVHKATGIPIHVLMIGQTDPLAPNLAEARRRMFDLLYAELQRLAAEDFNTPSLPHGIQPRDFAFMAHLGASRLWLADLGDESSLQELVRQEAEAVRQAWLSPGQSGQIPA